MSASVTDGWCTLVGCLPGGALGPTAPLGVLGADAVFGAARLLEAAGVEVARRHPWPKPFERGIEALLDRRGAPTTVLASGDPLHHGVGKTLLRHLAPEELAVHPAPSAFQLAAADMRWPLEDTHTVSLHTAPAAAIAGHAANGRRLLVLTRDGDAPAAICAALTARGFGTSAVAVLADLGGPSATRHNSTAAALRGPFAPLNTLAIACQREQAVSTADLLHDGCVTRDEVRRLTIAALGDGGAGGHLWDVGAGSGAVAIDWCRAGGTATLFETNGARVGAIQQNLDRTRTSAAVLEGDAGEHLDLAAQPSAIFLGGAVGSRALFAALWARLPAGGVFVSNAVTLEAEAETMARFAVHGGTLTRIALAHAAPVGAFTALKPAMPVLQWRVGKS